MTLNRTMQNDTDQNNSMQYDNFREHQDDTQKNNTNKNVNKNKTHDKLWRIAPSIPEQNDTQQTHRMILTRLIK
jgi:hypothetical protein